MDTAKLFINGRSQAVRLPKEFRFEGDEVMIKRVGDAVVLLPRHGWRTLFDRPVEPGFELNRSSCSQERGRSRHEVHAGHQHLHLPHQPSNRPRPPSLRSTSDRGHRHLGQYCLRAVYGVSSNWHAIAQSTFLPPPDAALRRHGGPLRHAARRTERSGLPIGARYLRRAQFARMHAGHQHARVRASAVWRSRTGPSCCCALAPTFPHMSTGYRSLRRARGTRIRDGGNLVRKCCADTTAPMPADEGDTPAAAATDQPALPCLPTRSANPGRLHAGAGPLRRARYSPTR